MSRQLDFPGKSGAVYRYTVLEEDRALPPAGANYLIAKVNDLGSAKVVFAGETDNFSSGSWRRKFDEARQRFGATDVLMRLNVRAAVRRQEQDDIVEAHNPPMNGGPIEEDAPATGPE
ncbi:MAG: hypothetical protein ABW042_01700 [Phenylobacterium sp.]